MAPAIPPIPPVISWSAGQPSPVWISRSFIIISPFRNPPPGSPVFLPWPDCQFTSSGVIPAAERPDRNWSGMDKKIGPESYPSGPHQTRLTGRLLPPDQARKLLFERGDRIIARIRALQYD